LEGNGKSYQNVIVELSKFGYGLLPIKTLLIPEKTKSLDFKLKYINLNFVF
jgi:hypothetical protein